PRANRRPPPRFRRHRARPRPHHRAASLRTTQAHRGSPAGPRPREQRPCWFPPAHRRRGHARGSRRRRRAFGLPDELDHRPRKTPAHPRTIRPATIFHQLTARRLHAYRSHFPPMNARPSSLLRRTLLAALCATLFTAPSAHAVNHNPASQRGEKKLTGDVVLANPELTYSDGSYTASVEVTADKDTGVAQYGLSVELREVDENGGAGPVIDTKSVNGVGVVTFDNLDVQKMADCGCGVAFKLIGATGEPGGDSTLKTAKLS